MIIQGIYRAFLFYLPNIYRTKASNINQNIEYTYYAVLRSKHAYIIHDIQYMLIFDISIQFKLCRTVSLA